MFNIGCLQSISFSELLTLFVQNPFTVVYKKKRISETIELNGSAFVQKIIKAL